MKIQPQDPAQRIETEAEDHAEETRYAVSHHGRELHPEKPAGKKPATAQDRPDEPWQVD